MIRDLSPTTLVLLLLATGVAATAQETPEEAPSFTEVAAELRVRAETAFAEERWNDAVTDYGRLAGHLLGGGYEDASDAVAECRLKIAVAFHRAGDAASARTMLTHLEQRAPDYETARRDSLLAEVETALGLPVEEPSAPDYSAPRWDNPVRVSGDVMRPEKVHGFEAQYTSDARRMRIQGVVILEVVIDTWGGIRDVKVLKPLPAGLDQAAVEAVKKWKFKPATLRGQPVPVLFHLTVNFRLP